MNGIKGIAEILKRFTMVALLALVKPNRDQRQKRKALLDNLNGTAKYLNFIIKAPQQFHIEKIQAQKLEQTVYPGLVPKSIECQNGQNSDPVIIHHRRISDQETQYRKPRGYKYRQQNMEPCFAFLNQRNDQQTEQECPNYILVIRVKDTAAIHQIKRYFCQ